MRLTSNKKGKIELEALKHSSSHIQELCSEGGGGGGGEEVDVRIEGCTGCFRSVFLIFNKNFLYLLLVPLVGLGGLVWGFGAGRGGLSGGEVGGIACWAHSFWGWIAWSVLGADAFGWFLSFPGLPSGQSAVSGIWTLERPRRFWRGTRSRFKNFSNVL